MDNPFKFAVHDLPTSLDLIPCMDSFTYPTFYICLSFNFLFSIISPGNLLKSLNLLLIYWWQIWCQGNPGVNYYISLTWRASVLKNDLGSWQKTLVPLLWSANSLLHWHWKRDCKRGNWHASAPLPLFLSATGGTVSNAAAAPRGIHLLVILLWLPISH